MIEITPPKESDHRFVVKSFMSSCPQTFPYRLWKPSIIGHVIDELLTGNGTTCLVARHPEESNTRADIYGWLSVRKGAVPLVLYAYVKYRYRKLGVCRKLFKAAGVDPAGVFYYGYTTENCREIEAAGKIPASDYNPKYVKKYG